MSSPEMTLYHYAPLGSRASIEKHGLLPRPPGAERSFAEEGGDEPGVYLFIDLEQAEMLDEGEIWEVDVTGLELEDADYVTGVAYSRRSDKPIEPSRLTWLKEAVGESGLEPPVSGNP